MTRSQKQQRTRIEKLILARLIAMLEDDTTSNGDIFKAASLFCDHFRGEDEAHPDTVEVRFTD